MFKNNVLQEPYVPRQLTLPSSPEQLDLELRILFPVMTPEVFEEALQDVLHAWKERLKVSYSSAATFEMIDFDSRMRDALHGLRLTSKAVCRKLEGVPLPDSEDCVFTALALPASCRPQAHLSYLHRVRTRLSVHDAGVSGIWTHLQGVGDSGPPAELGLIFDVRLEPLPFEKGQKLKDSIQEFSEALFKRNRRTTTFAEGIGALASGLKMGIGWKALLCSTVFGVLNPIRYPTLSATGDDLVVDKLSERYVPGEFDRLFILSCLDV